MSQAEGRLIFFNGTVMRGQAAHENLRGATFLHPMRTRASYHLYSIRDEYPAMREAAGQGISVPGELYFVPHDVWPEIEETEPPGLYCGRLALSGGEVVYGMLGTDELIEAEGTDISQCDGWVNYLQTLTRH